MRNERGRSGRPYRRARATLKAKRLPCHICGRPINYELPAGHPEAFVLDHIQSMRYGGDPLDPRNHGASHFICNARKGTKSVREVVVIPRSRDW